MVALCDELPQVGGPEPAAFLGCPVSVLELRVVGESAGRPRCGVVQHRHALEGPWHFSLGSAFRDCLADSAAGSTEDVNAHVVERAGRVYALYAVHEELQVLAAKGVPVVVDERLGCFEGGFRVEGLQNGHDGSDLRRLRIANKKKGRYAHAHTHPGRGLGPPNPRKTTEDSWITNGGDGGLSRTCTAGRSV